MQETEIDLRDLWRVLWGGRLLIIGLCVIAGLVSYMASRYSTPIYESSTKVLVRPNSASDLAFLQQGQSVGSAQSAQTDLANDVQILTSRQIALEAAKQLGIADDPQSAEFHAFQDSISVDSVANTGVLVVKVQDADPKLAASAADALVQAFIAEVQQSNRENATNALDFINSELDRIGDELKQTEQQLADEQKDLGATQLNSKETYLFNRLNDLNSRLLSVQNGVSDNSAQSERIKALIEQTQADLAKLADAQTRLNDLGRNLSVTQDTYTLLKQRAAEMQILQAYKSANIDVIDPAAVPTHPIKPRKMMNALLAAFLGLFVGVGLAFLREYLDESFRDADEIQTMLGVPILGRIPEASHGQGR